MYKKTEKTENYGSLLTNTLDRYNENKNNIISGNRIVINPLNTIIIENDLSTNNITTFDVSSTSINTQSLLLDSNDTYNKLSLTTDVIPRIKNIIPIDVYDKKNNYMYDPDMTYIYNDITGYTNGRDASGVLGGLTINASGFNNSFGATTQKTDGTWTYYWANWGTVDDWHGQNVNEIKPNDKERGIRLTIPTGCNVLWVALLSKTTEDRYNYFTICDQSMTCYGIYGAGRNLNSNIAPGGFITSIPFDSGLTWVSIPLNWLDTTKSDNKVILTCYHPSTLSVQASVWLSKCAFSSNPWNHVGLSASVIYHNLNSTQNLPANNNFANFKIAISNALSSSLSWQPDNNTERSNWNGSNRVSVLGNKNAQIRIPIIKSGKNKILYFVTSNTGDQTESLQVSLVNSNSQLIPLPNLKTTYSNPFSRHFNSRIYNSYKATIIPYSLIVKDSFGRAFVTINIFAPFGTVFWFKELGTHDEF